MDYPNRDDLLNGKFTDGDPANNILASRDSAAQMNAVYDEIINVIRFAGIEPDSNQYDQLKQALEFYRNASNLSSGTVPVSRLPVIPVNKIYGAKTLFEKNVVSQPAFQLDVGTLKNAADLTVVVNDVAYEYREGAELVLPSAMSIGTDYAVFATPDGLVASENFTVPEGYTALTSRRVGGFHYQDGVINEYSIYDVKYKPDVRDPRGMVRSPLGIWADIYLLNTSPDINGTSAYNVTIADGASPPKKPQYWGGDGVVQYSDFSQYTASRVLAAYGKRLPNSHEFEQLAFGSTTGYVVGVDPVTTQFDVSARSIIGCEQVSGHMWQWGADRSENVAVIFAGSWDSSSTGALVDDWSRAPSFSATDFAVRGVCDHFEQL